MELEAIGKRPRASSGGSSSSLASDRLSSLPDCLIHHIMSFLKARQVVQTCVLSTRWRHLWRSVPCLDIDQEEFKTAGPNRDEEKEWHDFADFTDHLLIPNNISIAHLDTFQLQLSVSKYPYDKDKQAARWIRHGIKYSGQDPGIQCMKLNSASWRLKRLHLSNLYLDDSFMNHISSGCQYLEDLELKSCNCSFHEITSHTMKNLILKGCQCYALSVITSPMLNSLIINGGWFAFISLRVIAPAVAYLLLDVSAYSFRGCVSFDEMSSLAEASIFLRNCVRSELSKDQFKLLCSLSNVTNLVLSGFQTMVIGEEFPEFQNLRTLLLEKCDLSDNFQMLGHFLQHSPNLEKLTLDHCKFSKDPKRKKGNVKSNKAYLNQFDVRCKNLKLTKIIYNDDDAQKLLNLLFSISSDLPKNNIKFTKVGPGHP
ncbi:hypothetical protein BDA96_06G097000 [Sorghum bicolor]|uniref:F-box domain-containing protein n=2 Tax=Sorghum bicolor TaxID=4558 RepID=C5Y8T8_SORBI|nr:putative FBD-associated F-box protein At5g38570 [Sorghum bicolor]EES12212.1 hypothetical protein SORBI_3006G088400 [Sorghum bicolor]KAG0525893.1 hypothetical protein BDA96_06G097000 [Sorghum bicolor]OQU81628.1 hypothetical protein SORBI_3006G088400 [Sorghum bicolor]|eukprot:XP_002447884.1 putative FBD-associated F-box protein At5g38570 [Sorghum bicolor]